MAKYSIIACIKLTKNHNQTGKTRHFIQGSLMNLPDSLQIIQFEGDDGYYLLYIDQKGNEITDTLHNSIDDALVQAELEFSIKSNEWKLFLK